ncbi:DUF397 domain-containing protein [Streptomyces sp. NPDC002851]
MNLEWFKSSYSTDEGAACVEVAWAKSSYSTGDGPECVEVATTPDAIHVRDSKNPDGPQLAFAPAAWDGFTQLAKRSD